MARRRPTRNSNRKWLWRAALVALIVLPAIAWLLPRRVHDIVSIDGRHRWEHADAPPRQRIVWQPAEKLPTEVATAPAGERANFARPQWADGGMTLYYTLYTDEGADIYRSRFDGNSWTSGVAVDELNSPADDFGPVISRDGQELYLYSNRTGGYGGFDLYVSRKTDSGWTTPRNVGPRINSPAHEYDPAVTPDGQRLFFSSNRTQAMQARIAAADGIEPTDAIWQASLRSEPGLRQFDIYLAQRSDDATWQTPQPVDAVNSSASNEGEPYVSPNGAFLYFASDRANAHGDQANYDIYRARLLGDSVVGLENLGPGVNTAANEHEPALSAEGFRIVFSSDRLEDDDKPETSDAYALYVSQASEIYDVAGWDTSHLSLITDNLWFIVLLLLMAALLAAIVWYLRQVSLRRAPIPAFFLIALLLHLLLATGAYFVPLDGMTLVERIKNEMDKVVASNVTLESPQQQPRENAYEKVADVQAASAVDVSPAPRDQAQPEHVALTQDFNAPRTASDLPQSRPVAPVVVPPAPEQPMTAENPQLARQRRPLQEQFANNQIQLEQTEVTPESDTAPSPRSADVAINKTDSPPQEQLAALTTPQIHSPTPLKRESIESRPTQNTTTPRTKIDESTIALNRRARSVVEQFDQPKINLNNPTANAPAESDIAQANAANVNAARQADAPEITPNAATFESRTTSPRSTNLTAAAINAAEPSPARTPSQPNMDSESSLSRQDRLARADFSAVEPIPLESDAPAQSATEQGFAAASPDVKVELNRTAAGAPQLNFQSPAANSSGGSQASSVTPDASAAAEVAAAPSQTAAGLNAVAEMFDRQRNRPFEIATGKIEFSGGTPNQAPSDSDLAAAGGRKVEVNRDNDNASRLGDAIGEVQTLSGSTDSSKLTSAEEAVRQALAGIPGTTQSAEAALEFRRARRALPVDGALVNASFEAPVGETPSDIAGDLAGAPDAAVRIARQQDASDVGSLESLLGEIGRSSPGRQGLPEIGGLARVELDASFSGDVGGSPLGRKDSRPAFLSYARGKIGLEAMLRLRVTDDETKKDLIEAYGGSPDTLPAVARGLTWLANVQHEDGSWKLHQFPKGPQGEKYSGQGKSKSDTAATGLALLPFLGDGHTHLGGKYQATVERGIRWLLEHQDDDGNLFTGGEGNAHMYSHGIAAIALCEAYGMTEDEQLREPAQRAIDYIARAQHNEGGWRYRPGDAGDTSVVGWQVMALKSAQMAGLNVPQSTLDKARRYLASARRGKDKAEYGYQKSSGGTPAMTAEGLLCYQYLGAKEGEPQLLRTVDVVANRPPKHGKDTSYYWYYGTQAMFHMQGEPWKKWNATMEEAVLSRQVTTGAHTGTWDPKDRWEQSGGRIMSTSLRLLMLEVTFRHLPLYRALE